MRFAAWLGIAGGLLGDAACVIVTGSTDGYREARADACAAAQPFDVPDASLGDSGHSVSGCLACVAGACGSELSACRDDCVCRDSAAAFFDCLGGGGGVDACVARVLDGGATPMLLSLGACIERSGCASSSCGGGS
jgi:hypothetical protein